jgi:hypothetical protein
MSEQRIWTADELLAKSPDEREAIVREGFVNDPSLVSPDLLSRARKKIDERIAATEESASTVD